MSSTNNKKIYITGIILLLVVTILLGDSYFKSLSKNKINTEKQSSQLNETTVSENTKDNNDISLVYKDISDKDFVNFATNVIEKRCPYYKPDGATYRDCLSSWEQDLADKLLPEQQDEVHAYCSTFTQKYAEENSLEGTEIFLKCSIYKFQ